jgi:hypothetical protein
MYDLELTRAAQTKKHIYKGTPPDRWVVTQSTCASFKTMVKLKYMLTSLKVAVCILIQSSLQSYMVQYHTIENNTKQWHIIGTDVVWFKLCHTPAYS